MAQADDPGCRRPGVGLISVGWMVKLPPRSKGRVS
jgi:hypothetical protein